jgi:hypothetical protein
LWNTVTSLKRAAREPFHYGGQDAQDQLLHWLDFSSRVESLFTPILISLSKGSAGCTETGDNGRMQTKVCNKTKGVQSVDLTRGQMLEGYFDGLLGKLRGLLGEGGA